MKVIEYLNKYGLEKLQEELAIKVREYPDRIVLNYNQIDSPKFHPIVRECRGLILGLPNFNILSRTFDRFFNMGEVDPSNNDQLHIDITEYIGYEKIDGSLIPFYWDGIDWQCATRGTAYAEGPTNMGDGKTFRDIIEFTIKHKTGYDSIEDFCEGFSKDNVYIFELVSPDTRVVKPYGGYDLYILAIRDKFDGSYLDPEGLRFFSDHFGVNMCKTYTFNSVDNCIKASQEMESAFDEGFVLYNPITEHRIKVKNPAYVAIAHMRQDGVLSEKRIIKLVFMNEYPEYLGLFPEDKRFFEPYIEAYGKMITEVNKTWETSKDIEDQRDFAMQVKDTKVKTFMFLMRKGKSVSAIIDGMTENTRINTIKQFLKE
jgi:hypothetical protein